MLRLLGWLVHRHPIAVCLVLFGGVMLGIKYGATWLVEGYGAWIAIPVIGAAIAFAHWWEKRHPTSGP